MHRNAAWLVVVLAGGGPGPLPLTEDAPAERLW